MQALKTSLFGNTKRFNLMVTLSFITICSFSQVTQNLDSLKLSYKKNPTNLETISQLAQCFETTNVDSASYYAHKLLSIAHKDDFKYQSRAYNSLANCDLVKNNLDGAIKKYLIAIDLTKKAGLNLDKAVYQASLAQVYLNKGEMKNAIQMYNNALSFQLKQNDSKKKLFYLSTIYSGLGDSFNFLGQYHLSLKNLFLSLKYSKQINDPISIAITYNSIASVYNNLKDYNKSKQYNTKALDEFNKTNYPLGKATVLFNLADNYFRLGKVQSALKNLEESKKIILATNTEYNLGNIYQLFGEINSKAGNQSLAIDYYTKSLAIHKKSGATMYYGQAMVGLALCYEKLNQNQKTKGYLLEALSIFEKENLLKEKKETLELLISNSLSNESKKVTEDYFNEYKRVEKQFLDTEKQKAIISEEIKNETQLKEAKIKTQELQIEKEKTNRNIAIAGILFVVLVGSGIWYFYRSRQKQKDKDLEFELNNLHNNINEMELQTLNQQLDPHEIKTYIDLVTENLMRQDEKLYNQLINLWDITNVVLNHKEITADIKTEIENLKKYLIYQQEIVFPKFEFNIINNVKDEKFKIPRLLLKNLAVNSIKHGIKGVEGEINIELFEKDNNVYIHVKDNGKGMDKENIGNGIGISTYRNIFTKLNLKNKEKASINFLNLEKGVLVNVCIPKNYIFSN